LLALRLGARQQVGRWTLAQSLRIDNLANRRYVGSVIVNQANQQFYEPGLPRQWQLGLTAAYKF
jgi:iron complex outermembrane recepter protein